MKSKTLTELLKALREAREDLISRSVSENPELFGCLFQYENHENLLSLSFEREYSIFLNSNMEKFSSCISDFQSKEMKDNLMNITEKLVNFKKSKTTSCVDTLFIHDKVKSIEKIFTIFDKDKDRLSEINYMKRKDQVLFEREFAKLLGE